MKLDYETDRLQLLVCNEEYTDALLLFMTENKDFFAPYEPLRQPSFYTREFSYRMKVLAQGSLPSTVLQTSLDTDSMV